MKGIFCVGSVFFMLEYSGSRYIIVVKESTVMNTLDEQIIQIIKQAGGIDVPYSFVYEKLGLIDYSEKKKVRTIIRRYCKEKKGYKKGYPDLFLITPDPENLSRRLITIKYL